MTAAVCESGNPPTMTRKSKMRQELPLELLRIQELAPELGQCRTTAIAIR